MSRSSSFSHFTCSDLVDKSIISAWLIAEKGHRTSQREYKWSRPCKQRMLRALFTVIVQCKKGLVWPFLFPRATACSMSARSCTRFKSVVSGGLRSAHGVSPFRSTRNMYGPQQPVSVALPKLMVGSGLTSSDHGA